MRIEGAVQEHLDQIVKIFCETNPGEAREMPEGITNEEWAALCQVWAIGYQEGLRALGDDNGDDIAFMTCIDGDEDPEGWVEDGSHYCEFGEWG